MSNFTKNWNSPRNINGATFLSGNHTGLVAEVASVTYDTTKEDLAVKFKYVICEGPHAGEIATERYILSDKWDWKIFRVFVAAGLSEKRTDFDGRTKDYVIEGTSPENCVGKFFLIDTEEETFQNKTFTHVKNERAIPKTELTEEIQLDSDWEKEMSLPTVTPAELKQTGFE